MRPFSPEEQRWVAQQWLPLAVRQSGYRSGAVVVATDIYARLATSIITTNVGGLPLRYRSFDQEADALAWLRQQPGSPGGRQHPRTFFAALPMHHLFAENQPFRANGRLWIEGPADRFLGIGRLELLERIAATGSISRAAKEMGMSYKKAWDLVSSMNAQARQPLVGTQAGGAHGGGAVLTEAGAQAVAEFRAMQARFAQFLADETARLYQ